MVEQTNFSGAPLRTLPPAPSGAGQTSGSAKATTAAPARAKPRKSMNFSTTPFWMGTILSALWVVVVVFAVMGAGPASTFAGLPLANWAIGVSAIVSPMAMIWMVAAYLQRAADVQSVTEPLRRQLAMITGESGAAEVRIRRFNQAIKEQLDLLRSTKNLDDSELMALLQRLGEHKTDLEAFEQNSLYHVQEIQDVIHRSMQHIDQLMEDKFAMLRILDGKLVQSGEDMNRQTQTMREQITLLLQDIESNALLVASAVERSMQDSRKLSDTARTQETNLLSAAETAATTLGELSGRIDADIAHFLGRTEIARIEAERLSTAIDTQARSIEEFSALLPSRVSEAEAVLRGVADRLYASEQLAREQAGALAQKLDERVDSLQTLLDRFSSRVGDIDGTLQQRRSDLDGLVVRISAASDDLASQMDGAIAGLSNHANGTLERFAAANEEARRGTDAITAQLAETAARYEAATRHLGAVSEANGTQLRALSHEMAQQLTQFEALGRASQQAGQDVTARATAALQNLQQLLERLLAARDAAHGVGDALTEKLRGAVDQNERVITRINEAARMTVHALGMATETLTQQEAGIATQAQASEGTLRAAIAEMEARARGAEESMRGHNDSLGGMLASIRERLDSTDKRLQDFADYASAPVQQAIERIDSATGHGRESIARYGDDMHHQLERLQEFNVRVGAMGQDVGRMTTETLAAIEETNARFASLRAAQDETARQTVAMFSTMAERLEKEIGALGSRGTEAASILQNAAEQVGKQSVQIQTEAQDSSAKIQFAATVLQNEAAAVKSALETQATAIGAELARSGEQFKNIEQTLKERADTTYALLDRVSAHYNEVTRLASEEMERRASKLDITASEATGRVQSLSASMESQLSLISAGAAQMEGNASRIVSSGAQTISRLEEVNAKLAFAHEAAVEGSNKAIGRMEDAAAAFKREQTSLDEVATASAAAILQSSSSFGEHASRILDTTHQVEHSLSGLNSSTASFAQQSEQVRAAMEQHNARLIASLKESIDHIEGTSSRLQQTAATAILSADQATVRFNTLSDSATARIEGSTHELFKIADKTEGVLGSLSADLTRQVAALNVASEQIVEQHRQVTTANETQRAHLLDLFDKMGAAHKEASTVAERTIARLTETVSHVQKHLGQLSDTSQESLAHITTASRGFSEQAKLLIDHACQAEAQARSAMNVTSSIQEQTGKLREALGEETMRAAELMKTLLSHLSSGSGEIRALSDAAGTALTDLQMGLARQTGALNESMDQIASREQTLSQALDAQRETLSGLITRLTFAQDETAASAGRAAERLSEETIKLLKGVETIESRVTEAGASISAANDSIGRETAAVISGTQAAEAQTKQLLESAETVQKKAADVCALIRSQTQETSEGLSALVGALEGNAQTVQTASRAAENAIANLGNAVSQQTTAITTNLAAIEGRQSSLSAAMDVQRETLGDMVTRLTLAQDETAAAAERSAARLSDSTGQIVRQMDSIETQTQGVLASVRSASSGLAEESTAIGQHTKQAEEQVRDMLKATSGMHQEARTVREAMRGETDQTLEHIRTVMTQLEGSIGQLKQQSGHIAGVMDKSALDFSTLAKNAAETLQKQADALARVSDQAQGRIESINEKIRESSKLVADAGGMAEGTGLRLADAAEQSTTQLIALIASMNDGERGAREALEKASLRLADTRVTLERELQAIAEMSARAVQSVMGAGSALAIQSDALRANLASSESALTQAADVVREETLQLPALLNRSTTALEDANKTFKKQAGDVVDTMIKTTDRCIGTAGAVRDTMMDEARHLTGVAELAGQTLQQFNDALRAQIDSIKAGAGVLSNEQRAMIDAAAQTVTNLSAAGDRLTKLRGDTQQVAVKLAQDFDGIEARAGVATQRLAGAGDALAKQIEALASMTEKAEGKMIGSSQGFREQLERVRTGVQTQIDDVNRGLMQITAQLDRTGTSLRAAMAGTVVDVEKIAARFEQTSKDTAGQLTDRTARMRVATEEVGKLLGSFSDQIEGLLDRMGLASEGIKRHETDLVGHLQQAFSHLGGVAERLQSTRALADNVSEATLSKLGDVATQVEKQMRHMAEGGQTVTGIIQSVSQAYVDQVGRVSSSVTGSQDQIVAMTSMIDSMQQRMDRMRVTLKLQGDDLMSSMETILGQLSRTGDTIETVVEGSLREKALNNLKRIS